MNIYKATQIMMGQRIRQMRERRGMTQSALGDAVGVSEADVRRWEMAEAEMTAAQMKRIARALGKSVLWLLTGEMEAPAYTAQDENDRPAP